jgi:hypothetical protein
LGCSCIFVKRAKREERGRALRRETTFAGGEARIPRKTTGTNYEATNNIKYQSSTDLRGRTSFIVLRNRGEQQHGFLEILARIPRLPYSTF